MIKRNKNDDWIIITFTERARFLLVGKARGGGGINMNLFEFAKVDSPSWVTGTDG